MRSAAGEGARYRRRESPSREADKSFTAPQPPGSLPIGIDELPVGRAKHGADRLGGCMDRWSGRAVVSEGLVVRVLAEDGFPAKDGAAGAQMAPSLDRVSHQSDDALPVHGGFEPRPAGER